MRRNSKLAGCAAIGGLLAAYAVPQSKFFMGAALGTGIGLATAHFMIPKKKKMPPMGSGGQPLVANLAPVMDLGPQEKKSKNPFVTTPLTVTSQALRSKKFPAHSLALPSVRHIGPLYDIIPAKKSSPPGWLGMICGYGTYIRFLQIEWLRWKAQSSPWDVTTPIPGDAKRWMINTQVEPPGPGISGFDDTDEWQRFLDIGTNPSEVVRTFLDTPRHLQNYKFQSWIWAEADDWGLTYPRVTGSEHTKRITLPKWWEDSDWDYLTRVREYYKTANWLVWAGLVYAIHTRREIPHWYRMHCQLYGVPIPSRSLRANRRYLSESTYFVPAFVGQKVIPPVSIHGTSSGTDIPQSDVDLLLETIIAHTPPPGARDVIRPPGEPRGICDWMWFENSAQPFRPSWGLPENWSDIILQRRMKEARGSWVGKLADIVQVVGWAIGSAVGAGLLKAVAQSLVTGLMSICQLGADLFDFNVGGLVGDSSLWNTAITAMKGSGGLSGSQAADKIRQLAGPKIEQLEKWDWNHSWDLFGGLNGIASNLDGSGRQALNDL